MDRQLLRKAKNYYRLVLQRYLSSRNPDDYFPYSAVVTALRRDHFSNSSAEAGPIHTNFVAMCLRELMDEGYVDQISDEFTGPFIRPTRGLEQKVDQDPETRELRERYAQLGGSGNAWL